MLSGTGLYQIPKTASSVSNRTREGRSMWSEQVPMRVGVTTGWCSHWSRDEAVRELLQNQFDAIVENCGKYMLGPSNPWTACKPCKTNGSSST